MFNKLFDVWSKDICKCHNKNDDDCSKLGVDKLGISKYLTLGTTKILKNNSFLNNILSPNILTTFSLLSILGIYLGTKKYYYLSGILYLLGCYFDVADGIHARFNNKCTDFGDYYDHVTDILQIVLVMYYIFFYIKISKRTRTILFIIICISLITTFITLGCEEDKSNSEGSKTLYLLRYMCPKMCQDKIGYLKWLGYFTLQIVITLILIYYKQFDKLINKIDLS